MKEGKWLSADYTPFAVALPTARDNLFAHDYSAVMTPSAAALFRIGEAPPQRWPLIRQFIRLRSFPTTLGVCNGDRCWMVWPLASWPPAA